MTSRRQWLAALGAALLCAQRSFAQGKPYRVGFLSSEAPSEAREQSRLAALRAGLRERGYVEGRDIVIEARYADGKYDRLPALAKELVDAKVDVLVASGTKPLIAAREATATVPIVMGSSGDAQRVGASANLARPTANVTGWTFFGAQLAAKLIEILHQAVPRMTRIGYLLNPAESSYAFGAVEEAASSRKLALSAFEVRAPGELPAAFDLVTAAGCQALMVQSGSMFAVHAKTIAELALRNRLPSGSQLYDYADVGGLMTYGPDRLEGYRRAGAFIDKLVKGARVSDLPIEQAETFDLVINVATAKALGLALPQALAARARLI
jgi:putative ABC transport system substrate-binding protein